MAHISDEDVHAVVLAAVAGERERCAKTAEGWRSPYGEPRDLEVAQAIATAIREAK